MKPLVTPKQVGRALDVSESSLKRWCDNGEIATQYTAGGHRRIALTAMLALGTRRYKTPPDMRLMMSFRLCFASLTVSRNTKGSILPSRRDDDLETQLGLSGQFDNPFCSERAPTTIGYQ